MGSEKKLSEAKGLDVPIRLLLSVISTKLQGDAVLPLPTPVIRDRIGCWRISNRCVLQKSESGVET
jgi:hypothetical protein